MKVDLGTCAVCGAKNSKFVETCYKCGAALPWAPNYVAPTPKEVKPAPQSTPAAPAPKPQPKPTPQPTPQPAPQAKPTSGDAKTVAVPPLNVPSYPEDKTPLSDAVAQRASRPVSVPTWAIAAGVLGCIALGVALTMAFGGRGSEPAALAPPALTPLPTSAPATVETPQPNSTASVTPEVATPAPAAPAVATPAPAAPAAVATPAPGQAPATAPVATATLPAPATAATSAPAVPAVANGPTFDTLLANTMTGTAEQKTAYFKTVQNTKVSWRGDFVSLGNTPSGPLTVRCKSGNNTAIVTIILSTNPAQTLAPMQPNQSISVEGNLSSFTTQGFNLSEGRIN